VSWSPSNEPAAVSAAATAVAKSVEGDNAAVKIYSRSPCALILQDGPTGTAFTCLLMLFPVS